MDNTALCKVQLQIEGDDTTRYTILQSRLLKRCQEMVLKKKALNCIPVAGAFANPFVLWHWPACRSQI